MQFLLNLLEKLELFVSTHVWFAPLLAVLLPFVEAIIPTLPLTILIGFSLNMMATVYGSMEGTIYTIVLSTLGSFLGMVFVFGIIRLTFAPYFARKVEENKYGKMFLHVVDGPNAFLVLLLLSNPFLPSSILNYALSLTKTKVPRYLLLTFASRLIIVLFLVFLGSVFDIQNHPINILWLFLFYFVLFLFWYLWNRYHKHKVKDSLESDGPELKSKE